MTKTLIIIGVLISLSPQFVVGQKLILDSTNASIIDKDDFFDLRLNEALALKDMLVLDKDHEVLAPLGEPTKVLVNKQWAVDSTLISTEISLHYDGLILSYTNMSQPEMRLAQLILTTGKLIGSGHFSIQPGEDLGLIFQGDLASQLAEHAAPIRINVSMNDATRIMIRHKNRTIEEVKIYF